MITEAEFRTFLLDGNWHTTRELADALDIHFTVDELGDTSRRLNDFIHTWDIFTSGEVIHGPQGYRLTKSATKDEVDATVKAMKDDAAKKSDVADKVVTVANTTP